MDANETATQGTTFPGPWPDADRGRRASGEAGEQGTAGWRRVWKGDRLFMQLSVLGVPGVRRVFGRRRRPYRSDDVDLLKHFPERQALVRPERGGEAALYAVVRVETERLLLITARSKLTAPPPPPGETVLLRSPLALRGGELRGRVAEESQGASVALIVDFSPEGPPAAAPARLAGLKIPARIEGFTAEPLLAMAEEVSDDGLTLLLDVPASETQPARVTLNPGDPEGQFSCTARVATCAELPDGARRLGMKFFGLSPQERGTLRERLSAAVEAADATRPLVEKQGEGPPVPLVRAFGERSLQLFPAPDYAISYEFRIMSTRRRRMQAAAPREQVGDLCIEEGRYVWLRAASEDTVHEIPCRVVGVSEFAYIELELLPLSPVIELRRRSAARVRVVLDGRMRDPTGQTEKLEVRDISIGGLLAATVRPHEPGAFVDLELDLAPSEPSWRGRGQVMRCSADQADRWLTGLRFVQVAPEDRLRLVRFCVGEMRGGGPEAG